MQKFDLQCQVKPKKHKKYKGKESLVASNVLNGDFKHLDKDVLTKEIQDHTKKVTAPYKYPRIIEYVDELPKTISGKIKRAEIRKR